VKDFMPVTLLMRSVGYMLTVHPSVPARSVKEFIALAKTHPGKLNYGSGGVGNVMQLSAESFSLVAGTKLTHVPYKGVGQAIIDLLAGRIEVCFITARSGHAHVRAGKLRALGISAPTRWSELPDVPTMDESGLKGYTYSTWYGLWLPGGAPVEYGNRIRNEVTKAFADAELKRKFVEEGLLPVGSTSQEFAKIIVDEIDYHRKLVAKIGLVPQ
jgi:tripartite-type tricarboxylate transporter receptor subunit TctC